MEHMGMWMQSKFLKHPPWMPYQLYGVRIASILKHDYAKMKTVLMVGFAQTENERTVMGMTNEEAIKIIELAIAEVEWNYPMDYAIAFETAISALEKQIPKKPTGIYNENESKKGESLYEEALIGSCPVCNQEVQLGMQYCTNCGQALKWSDSE